jgi:hypothetical protein
MALIIGALGPTEPAAAAGGDGVKAPPPHLERLAQGGVKPPEGPEPDPGGLPGYRKEMPSGPAARPIMPEMRSAPKPLSPAPADSGYSASSKPSTDSKKAEPK